MYDNIGGKIKGLAKATFFVEAISAIIVGIIWMSETDVDNIGAWCLIIFGPYIAWSSSWVLYGFGELIVRSCDTNQKVIDIAKLVCENKKTNNNIDANIEVIAYWIKDQPSVFDENEEQKTQGQQVEEKEKAQPQAQSAPTIKTIVKPEKSFKEKLTYSLKYQTVDGMISYLSEIDDIRVKMILKGPIELVRSKIIDLLNSLQDE
ncbi:MAG: hypothetical protein IIX44_00580 [Clostridia bacterium]|nr:hypothetical protein [Clostridia bacterium]